MQGGEGLGLPQQDAAEIVNGVEDGEWAILLGDDAEAIDAGVRSLPLGGVYVLHIDAACFVYTCHMPAIDRSVFDCRYPRRFDQVSFQWKNPDFLLKNVDFLLKNVDFVIQQDDMGSFSPSLAQQGDPSYFEGRQTQLARRKATAKACTWIVRCWAFQE